MASRSNNMPADNKANAKQILNQVKMEAAQEVGVTLSRAITATTHLVRRFHRRSDG